MKDLVQKWGWKRSDVLNDRGMLRERRIGDDKLEIGRAHV
jgi:hypothetical protein